MFHSNSDSTRYGSTPTTIIKIKYYNVSQSHEQQQRQHQTWFNVLHNISPSATIADLPWQPSWLPWQEPTLTAHALTMHWTDPVTLGSVTARGILYPQWQRKTSSERESHWSCPGSRRGCSVIIERQWVWDKRSDHSSWNVSHGRSAEKDAIYTISVILIAKR